MFRAAFSRSLFAALFSLALGFGAPYVAMAQDTDTPAEAAPDLRPGSIRMQVIYRPSAQSIGLTTGTPFYLMTEGVLALKADYMESHAMHFDEYLKNYGASPQLQKWAAEPGHAEILMTGLDENDPLLSGHSGIPEFETVRTKGQYLLPGYLRKGASSVYLLYIFKQETEALTWAWQEAPHYVKAQCRTDLAGFCTFPAVPPGEYAVSSVLETPVGDGHKIFWEKDVTVIPGTTANFSMTNADIKVLNSAKQRLYH